MSNYRQPSHIAHANSVLESYYDHFKRAGVPEFGSDMLHRDGVDQWSTADIVVAHRFLSKFERPDPSKKAELTTACFDGWISFEQELGTFNFDTLPLKIKGNAYRARELLHRWFADFKIGQDVEFTPGETYMSNRGEVSVYQKLSRKSNWCVTHDAADDFIRLCYNHRSLNRCARKFFTRMTQKDAKTLFASAPEGVHAGFWCFSQRMYRDVLTLVHGSRASTVDKSNDKRRFINVEPFCNIILQRFVSQGVRIVLRQEGNDLEIGQQVHRRRISDDCATVDFTNASDSTILDVCNRLFPSRVTKYLNRYRSPMVLVNGDYHLPHKLSSMGNGFTFEIMSALLLACARVFDPHATVYGDDVIIDNSVANEFIELAHGLGYRVNCKKTFIDSSFRESCGAFFQAGYGYIECFDIHWIESDSDLIITTNKFRKMASSHKGRLSELLIGAYNALVSCVPLRFMGPAVEPPSLETWVPHSSYRKRRMRSTDFVTQWKRCETYFDFIRSHYGGDEWVLLSIPRYNLKEVSPSTRVVPDCSARYAHYMYAGRVSSDLNRNKGKWIENLYFCDPSGTLVSVGEVKRLIKRETASLARQYIFYICTAWVWLSRISGSITKTDASHVLAA